MVFGKAREINMLSFMLEVTNCTEVSPGIISR